MKRFAMVVMAMLVLAAMGGCGAGTNVKPFDGIDTIVKADDVVVKDATVAVPLGILPVKDAQTLYSGDQVFVVLGLPPLEVAAQASAAPTLDPAAVTWTVYLADKNILIGDLTLLHTAISNGVAAQIKAARAAAPPKK